MSRFLFIFILLLFGVVATVVSDVPAAQVEVTLTPSITLTSDPVEYFVPEVLNSYPHDPGSWTQGLVFHDGYLYESAGLNGESDVRQVDPTTGNILRQKELDQMYFAEGLALVDDRLIQLTWQNNLAFVYDLDTFTLLDTYAYTGQGWGLCYDGEVLWMSDGSEILVARDAATFEIIRSIIVTLRESPISDFVTANNRRLDDLNELECVGNSVYANVWHTDFILRIDTASGQVTALIDATNLLTPEERAELGSEKVLNGVAYHAENDTFFLTGKFWPKLFEVRFESIGAAP